jgi:hypothetical protein
MDSIFNVDLNSSIGGGGVGAAGKRSGGKRSGAKGGLGEGKSSKVQVSESILNKRDARKK